MCYSWCCYNVKLQLSIFELTPLLTVTAILDRVGVGEGGGGGGGGGTSSSSPAFVGSVGKPYISTLSLPELEKLGLMAVQQGPNH